MNAWRLFSCKSESSDMTESRIQRMDSQSPRETDSLLGNVRSSTSHDNNGTSGLNLLFASLCIVDLFGVFPVVTLPRPIIDCGYLGLPLAACVFAMQIYTAVLLGRCWILAEEIDLTIVDKSRYPYAALAHLTMGRTMSRMVSVLLDVTIFGAGVPNLLVAAQNIQLLGLKISEHRFDVSFCYWLIIVGLLLCPVMWLGSPKDMKWLAVMSVATVCSVAMLTWTCMLLDKSQTPGYRPMPISITPSLESLAIAYGIMAFQFDIHPMILTVQVDMQQKNKLGKAILFGFLVTGTLFMITTAIALWKYGPTLQFNVLQGLPASVPLYVNMMLVTLQICLSMVVGTSALFQDVEDKLNIPPYFCWQRCLLRSSLLIVAVVIGEAVPRFDLIMGLIGGALTGPLMFIMPPLFYAKLRDMAWKGRLLRTRKAGLTPQRHSYYENSAHSIGGGDDILGAPSNTCTDLDASSADRDRAILSNLLSSPNYPGSPLPPDYLPYHDQYLQSRGGSFKCRTKRKSWLKQILDLECLSMELPLDNGPLSTTERILTLTIVFLGVCTTVAATFFSIRDTLKYANFTPPCIVNVTQASKLLSFLKGDL